MRSDLRTVILGLGLFFLLSSFYFLLPATPAHAVDVLNPVCQNADPHNLPQACKDAQDANNSDPNSDPIVGPNGILATVVNILSLFGGIIAVVVIIIGGIKLIVSGGDSNSVASARRTVLYAILSVGIIAMAQLAVRFIISRL